MTRRALVALALVVLCVAPALAADHSLFRQCEQNAFCKRMRGIPRDRDTPYAVVAKSARVVDGGHVELDLVNRDSGVAFVLRVTLYEDNTLRLHVREASPRRARFEANDLILEEHLRTITPSLVNHDDGTVLVPASGFGNTYASVVVQHAPFAVNVLAADGSTLMAVNEHRLFEFEHYRDRVTPTPEATPEATASPSLLDGVKSLFTGEEAAAAAAAAAVGEGKEEEEGKKEPTPTPTAAPTPSPSDEWEETFKTHTDTKRHGPAAVSLDISFASATHMYGVPEHTTSLALKNTLENEPYRLFNVDIFEYELDSKMALYGGVPFVLAHSAVRTQACFWHSAADTYVDISETAASWGRAQQREARWISETGVVDVFLFLGPTPADVFRQYTRVTGAPEMPPRFAIAYHQCRWNYKDEADVAGVDAKFDEHDIPYDVLWLDIEHTNGKRYLTWDTHHFPHPEEMQRKLAAKGHKMVTIVDPHIKRDSNYGVYSEARSAELFVKNKDGSAYEGWCWPGSSSWIDFFHPDAADFWARQLSLDKYGGSTEDLSIWNDMNEPSVFNAPECTMPRDNMHHGDVEHREVHNIYGTRFHRATHDALLRRSPSQRPFVLSRAFSAGSQRFGAVWTGDNRAEWGFLAVAQPMLLSLGLSGINFAGADVGGFFGDPTTELLVRWYQAGAFHPFFRAHAHLDTKRREPWLFGDDTTRMIRAAVLTRYSLLPYYYTLFKDAEETGTPVMRPLWVEFPAEVPTFKRQGEFMVGRGLLVRPVVSMGEVDVTVYFPGSEPWYDYSSYRRVALSEDQHEATVPSPLAKIPVFIRGGTVLPRKDRVRRSSRAMTLDPLTLIVAPDAAGAARGVIYEDDGESFAYRQGAFIRRGLVYAQGQLDCHDARTAAEQQQDERGATFHTPVVVERIIVLGMAAPPRSPPRLSLRGNPAVDLEYEHDVAAQVVVIRRPLARIAEDWTITIDA